MSHYISAASLQPGAPVDPGGPTALALESDWKHSRERQTQQMVTLEETGLIFNFLESIYIQLKDHTGCCFRDTVSN